MAALVHLLCLNLRSPLRAVPPSMAASAACVGSVRTHTTRCSPPQLAERLPSEGGSPTKKRHALLTFGFTGTGYYGLQSQSAAGDPERPTVSDVLRAALLAEGFIAESNFVTLGRTKWKLASRTDKGVHAACAAASVNLETLPAQRGYWRPSAQQTSSPTPSRVPRR